MKKTISVVLLSLLYFAPAFSGSIINGEDEIAIYRITDATTRSLTTLPEASISHEVLRVSFSSSGIYSLTVSDSMGSPVYISSLPADGMEYSYDLSGIGEGTFTLTLEGPSGEYEGVFINN